MALMRTVHPLDFIRVNTAWLHRWIAIPLNAPKTDCGRKWRRCCGMTLCHTGLARLHRRNGFPLRSVCDMFKAVDWGWRLAGCDGW